MRLESTMMRPNPRLSALTLVLLTLCGCGTDQLVTTTPDAATITTVSLSPVPPLAVGSTVTLQAVARNGLGQAVPGEAFAWTTSDASVLSISAATGATITATGLARGTAEVRVSASGHSVSALVTVRPLTTVTPPPAGATPRSDPGLAVPGERWNLTVTLTSVSGPQVCFLRQLALGTSHQELMAVQRSGQSIALVHDLLNWPTDDVELAGTVMGNDFTATSGWGPGFQPCGGEVFYSFEASASGRFSADGRSLTAEEVWSYRLPSGDTTSLHFAWSATPQ
jgi:hypothetical protein